MGEIFKYRAMRIESYEGNDTFLHCGDDSQYHLYCIVRIGNDGAIEIADNGFRNIDEAIVAWPEAAPM